MPNVRANGIDLYYEEHGSGEPLLLIMGWGGNATTWKPQIPGLAERFRVIAFDNRGVGRSSAPQGPYTIGELALDAVHLLDALEIERAHVFGISMGGMVAQELALAHPDRAGALVLGCTWAGGEGAVGRAELEEKIAAFKQMDGQSGGPSLEWFSDFLRLLWTDEALTKAGEYLQDFVFSVIRFPPTTHGLRAQADAVAAHDAYGRLPEIRHPTLVVTGSDDSLIDAANSEVLAERIPNAELRVFVGLRHAFHLERPDLVNPQVARFIQRFA
jgi:pimeloyl-ACP methyl ester carboxylesterase